jgi:hypothetical protein
VAIEALQETLKKFVSKRKTAEAVKPATRKSKKEVA